jgi:glucose/arabinose dehydrogenase
MKPGLIVLLLLLIINVSKAQTFKPGFSQQKVAPIEAPTAMAQAPDGRFYICSSKGGKGFVHIVKTDGTKTLFMTLDKVYTEKEHGVVGIAFDPDFTTNKALYIFYSADLSANGDQLGDMRNKIIKVIANGDQGNFSTAQTILEMDIIKKFAINYNHDGGTMHFGPDGKLYVAVGDQDIYCKQACYDLSRNSCGCANSAGTWPQDTNTYLGKILRINKDGSAPTDNPFYEDGASEVQKRLYVIGVRNPFTMHFRLGTSELYFNDVGSSGNGKREEINKISYSLSKEGKNFGWNRGQRFPDDGTPPSIEGYSSKAGFVSPIFAYRPDSGCAISAGVFYETNSANAYPAEYRGKYFFMDFCQGYIRYLDINTKEVKDFATDLNNLSGTGGGIGSFYLEVGQDGQFYHLVRSGTSAAGLYKISGPMSPNATTDKYADKYSFSVHPNPANDNLNIHLTGLKSEPATLSITNSLSKEVLSYKVNLTPGFFDQNFDIQSLERGMYYVNLITEGNTVTKKLVVE